MIISHSNGVDAAADELQALGIIVLLGLVAAFLLTPMFLVMARWLKTDERRSMLPSTERQSQHDSTQ